MGSTIHGVVSRSVRDSAAVLDCHRRLHARRPRTPRPPPARPFADEVGADPGRPKVGVLDHPLQPGVTGHPECAAAVAAAARLLESLGHHVEVAHPAGAGGPGLPVALHHHRGRATAAELDDWERGRPAGR